MRHKNLLYLLLVFFSLTVFSSCSDKKDKEPDPEPFDGTIKKTILLYAVASNNLYSNLISDKQEIIEGLQDVDITPYSMLVYEVIPNNKEGGETPRLLELKRRGDGTLEYEEIKRYDRSLYSTDPERIREVIDDVKTLREAESYGLILWSHALGWSPFFSDRDSHPDPSLTSRSVEESEVFVSETVKENVTMQSSFGYDQNSTTGYVDKVDIDELADAIPDNMFEFIWFDACMMSGIEAIYELRNKCKYFGGYPTEVYSPGMPYHKTIAYLLRNEADMKTAAEVFFDYYANNYYSYLRTATVAVVDMSILEDMAEFCKKNYADTGVPSTDNMDYYSGRQNVAYKFYDFKQYTKAKLAEKEDESLMNEFDNLLDRMIIYKAATQYEFTGRKLNLDEYSGISAHVYSPNQTGKAADYYRTLDWFKRVY